MQPIRRWSKTALISAVSLFLLTGCGQNIPVLDPKGPVGRQELHLIEWSFGVTMIIIVAVFILFAWILVKFRARPDNADYIPPEQEGNKLLEIVWTAIPIIIVTAIAIPTVITTFKLQKPPTTSNKTPIVIDVTSANWKWLFSYPKQGIETVNYCVIPAGVPVKFELTAIGPMNSFWVPALGGMEMDMPNKDLGLWLQADQPGDYLGRSANFSGKGFTHMTFHVLAKPQADFAAWANQVKSTAPALTKAKYQALLKPGTVGKMSFSTDVIPKTRFGTMPGMSTSNSTMSDNMRS